MSAAEPGSGGIRVLALIVAVLAVLAIPVALVMAGLSVMMFDAPGSTANPIAWAWFGLFCAGPFLAGATAVLGFVCAARPSHRLLGWMFVPALIFAGVFILLALTMSLL